MWVGSGVSCLCALRHTPTFPTWHLLPPQRLILAVMSLPLHTPLSLPEKVPPLSSARRACAQGRPDHPSSGASLSTLF